MDLFSILTGPVSRMAHVTRYSSFAVLRQETVAEHSWWVSFITLLLAEDLETRGFSVDREILLRRAIVHDLSECISGDIIRSYKYSSPEMLEATKAADTENMLAVVGKMGRAGQNIYLAWANAKSSDLEGDIIRFADMAAVVFYTREEYLLGNRPIARVLRDMYERWFCNFHEHPELGQYMDRMFPNRVFKDALEYADPVAALPRPIMRVHE